MRPHYVAVCRRGSGWFPCLVSVNLPVSAADVCEHAVCITEIVTTTPPDSLNKCCDIRFVELEETSETLSECFFIIWALMVFCLLMFICIHSVKVRSDHKWSLGCCPPVIGLMGPLFVSHLADVNCWQSLARGVSAGGDLRNHGGLWRRDAQTWGPGAGSASSAGALEGDWAVRPAAGAGGGPPPDEGNFHSGVRSETHGARDVVQERQTESTKNSDSSFCFLIFYVWICKWDYLIKKALICVSVWTEIWT